MTMRTSDSRNALRSQTRKGAARELEYDLLLDAVRMAIAPAPEKIQAPEASDENQLAWPLISIPA
jgi:hypothetical protein